MTVKESNKKVQAYFKTLRGRKFRKHHFTFLLFIYIFFMTTFILLSIIEFVFKGRNTDILAMLFSFFKPALIIISPVFLFDMLFGRIVAVSDEDGVIVEEEKEIVDKTMHITEVCKIYFKDIKNISYNPRFPRKYSFFNKEAHSCLLITLKNRQKITVRHAPISLFCYIKKYCPHAAEKKGNSFLNIIKDIAKVILILTVVLSVIIFFGR